MKRLTHGDRYLLPKLLAVLEVASSVHEWGKILELTWTCALVYLTRLDRVYSRYYEGL